MPDHTGARPTWAFRYLDGAWRELRNGARTLAQTDRDLPWS